MAAYMALCGVKQLEQIYMGFTMVHFTLQVMVMSGVDGLDQLCMLILGKRGLRIRIRLLYYLDFMYLKLELIPSKIHQAL